MSHPVLNIEKHSQDSEDGWYKLNTSQQTYAWWHIPAAGTIVDNLQDFKFKVVWNYRNKAMLTVTRKQTDDEVLRQEINPWTKRNIQKWLTDPIGKHAQS